MITFGRSSAGLILKKELSEQSIHSADGEMCFLLPLGAENWAGDDRDSSRHTEHEDN